MEDKDYISNDFQEIEYVAKKFNIAPSQVLRAKEEAGTGHRETVYTYIQNMYGGNNDNSNG